MDTQTLPDTTEFTLPEGCLSCGADLPIRVTPAGAHGVCKACGAFSRPQVRLTHEGLRVTYLPMGNA
jgi:hypothetical protein